MTSPAINAFPASEPEKHRLPAGVFFLRSKPDDQQILEGF